MEGSTHDDVVDMDEVVVEDDERGVSIEKETDDMVGAKEDEKDDDCDKKEKESKVEKVKKLLKKSLLSFCVFLIKNVIPSSSKDLDDPFLEHFAAAAKKEKVELKGIGGNEFFYLIHSLFFSGTHVMAYIFAVLPFLVNANLLDMSIAMIIFFYHLLQVPLSRKKSWDSLLFFSIFVIAIKYLFNMPIFCVCNEQSSDSLHMQPYCDHHHDRCNFRPKGQVLLNPSSLFVPSLSSFMHVLSPLLHRLTFTFIVPLVFCRRTQLLGILSLDLFPSTNKVSRRSLSGTSFPSSFS
jgi:hypothetical protein